MRSSSFAFFRGASAVMAGDLAATPVSGLPVQLSGDAHLLNFGGFASPERALVFDLNDFDETLRGPFEWDVKRLATSLEIAGRERNFALAQRRRAVRSAVRSYRAAMRKFAGMGDLDVWYSRLDADTLNADLDGSHDRKLDRALRRSEASAYRHDSLLAESKLTHAVDGTRRFVSRPPLIVPIEDPSPLLQDLFERYLKSLPPDRRTLLERFRYVDLARKVVGVGSVGTRCWIALLVGRDQHDPLVLQIKEAQASVLEARLDASPNAAHGQRIVEGQRLMQAASDIFLGWVHSDEEIEGGARDFYVRQLWDWKFSIHMETIYPRGLEAYARACGWTLARAHARTGDRVAIAAYLGGGDNFDSALVEFASSYADLNEQDHRALVAESPATAVPAGV